MIVVTTEQIEGKKIKESIGLVKGSTIRAKHLGKDILAFFKTLTGGELKSYTDMMNQAREEALNRMLHEAEKLGANAVVCLRFSAVMVLQGTAECIAYGTAVKI